MEPVDKLIYEAMTNKSLLRQRFENRLELYGISLNQFLEAYNLNFRTVNAILDASFKYTDLVSIIKLSSFLGLTIDQIVKEYEPMMPMMIKEEIEQCERRNFLLQNFNLDALKKDGVIFTVRDFDVIEKSILRMLDLENIYEYRNIDFKNGLYSTVKYSNLDTRSRRLFKNKASQILNSIKNPNTYRQDELKEFFPRIRQYSLDPDNGLLKVIQELYKLGITVVVHPSFTLSKSRGVTLETNDNPGIVLTNYGKKYSTLWFSLLHELYHVVFDWDDIIFGRTHVSEDDATEENEKRANQFAREYMFPNHRMSQIVNEINDPLRVKQFAIESDVHYSIIYDNYCYDNPDKYNKYIRYIRFPWKRLEKSLIGSISIPSSAKDIGKYYNLKIFNK